MEDGFASTSFRLLCSGSWLVVAIESSPSPSVKIQTQYLMSNTLKSHSSAIQGQYLVATSLEVTFHYLLPLVLFYNLILFKTAFYLLQYLPEGTPRSPGVQ